MVNPLFHLSNVGGAIWCTKCFYYFSYDILNVCKLLKDGYSYEIIPCLRSQIWDTCSFSPRAPHPMPSPSRWDRGLGWSGQAVRQDANAAASSRPAALRVWPLDQQQQCLQSCWKCRFCWARNSGDGPWQSVFKQTCWVILVHWKTVVYPKAKCF